MPLVVTNPPRKSHICQHLPSYPERTAIQTIIYSLWAQAAAHPQNAYSRSPPTPHSLRGPLCSPRRRQTQQEPDQGPNESQHESP